MDANQLYKNCVAQLNNQYPEGMQDLGQPLPFPGRGFFPVASGSFHTAGVTGDVKRKYLVLGQDWGSEVALGDLEKDAHADMNSPTAKNLVDLLARAGIPLEDCFFSNVLMGVRSGSLSTGDSPGWKDADFVQRCVDALVELIKAVQPEAIICLGRAAPSLLKLLFPACAGWEKAASFKDIDTQDIAVIKLDPHVLTVKHVVILLHPSYRKMFVKDRRYAGAEGEAAEVAILHALR